MVGYVFAALTGIGIVLLGVFSFFRLHFFGVGASTYLSFAVFCLMYGLLGFLFGVRWPRHSAWVLGSLIGLPMFVFLWPLNFGDPSPREQIPRFWAALSPFAACGGTSLGAQRGWRRSR